MTVLDWPLHKIEVYTGRGIGAEWLIVDRHNSLPSENVAAVKNVMPFNAEIGYFDCPRLVEKGVWNSPASGFCGVF